MNILYFIIFLLFINLLLTILSNRNSTINENYTGVNCTSCPSCRWGCDCQNCKSKYVGINTKGYDYLINKPNLVIGTWISGKDPLKALYIIFKKDGYGVIEDKANRKNEDFFHYNNGNSQKTMIQLKDKVYKVKLDKNDIDKIQVETDKGVLDFVRIRTLGTMPF